MAYSNFSTSNYLISGLLSPRPEPPLTFSAWINLTSAAVANRRIMEISLDSVPTTALRLLINTSNQLLAQTTISGNQQAATSTTTIGTNTWTHVFGRFYADGSRDCGINGITANTNSTNNYASGFLARIGVGGGAGSSLGAGSFSSGMIADVAIWTTLLTDNDLKAIASGIKSYNVKTNSLLVNYELNDSPTIDKKGNYNLSLTGSLINSSNPTTYNFNTTKTKNSLTKTLTFTKLIAYAGATKTQWRFAIDGGDYFYIITDNTGITNYSNVISSGLNFVEMQFPPVFDVKTSYREFVDGTWLNWIDEISSVASFTSYDKYYELSGITNYKELLKQAKDGN
jgi:hypothetical protein